MNINGIGGSHFVQMTGTAAPHLENGTQEVGDLTDLLSQLQTLEQDSLELPRDLAGDLYLDSLLQNNEAPVRQLTQDFTRLAGEYGAKAPIRKDTLRMAVIAAEPYLGRLGDDASESQVNDAFETGMRIALLKDWLMREEGMSSFPAMLKAVELEGRIPGGGEAELDLEIIRG